MFKKKKVIAAIGIGAIALSAQWAFDSYAKWTGFHVAAGDWPGFNRTHDSQRFSPLSEINKSNVGSLKLKCTFDLGEKYNFENGPVVVGGVMYLTTENDTYAIDAATCAQLWKYHRDFIPTALFVNRGVAFANDHLYRGSNDGYLVAIDAKTGTLLWESKVADPAIGESLPAVPVVWNGMVYIGQAGGDNVGVRGRMMAVKESDGSKLWTFELAPMVGPGSETWPESTAQVPRTGAATWTSYTIDKATGSLFIPAGNAAPDFMRSVRPGLNLYSDSVVILDATTGALKTYYQLTKADAHDWDIASAPVLYQGSNGHQMFAVAGKDGVLHFVDLDLKTEVFAKSTTSHLNGEVPITVNGTRFCPGVRGGTEWNGPGYNPTLKTFYVAAVDWCTTVKLSATGLPPVARPGDPFTGADDSAPFGTMDPVTQRSGWLTAFNADDGSVRWQYASATPLIAGVTPTAGGLVFAADLNGKFLALDADTGQVLFQAELGEPTGGGIVSYEAGGKQMVAVSAGLKSGGWSTEPTSSRVVIFGL